MEGVISLGVGEPDFKTPYTIRDAAIRSLEVGKTRYTSNWGTLELRREIANYMNRRFGLEYSPDTDIMVTVGGSEGIDAAIRAIVGPGDDVLIPEPCFVCYDPIVRLAGGNPVTIDTRAEDNFRLTASALEERITPNTKLLILPYPNNPTGAIMRQEDLEAVAEVILRHNLLVLSDEIYAEMTYGGPNHVSIASIPGMKERTVIVNGFSKAYSMTGWRLGFLCGPAPLLAVMIKIHQYAIMSAPTTSQYAAVEALRRCDDKIHEMVAEYNMRRRLVVDGFRKMGLDCFEPEGAFYIFPSIQSTGLTSEEFCEKLLHAQKVALVPGTAFGACGEGYVRVSYCYSIDHLLEAMRRIGLFLDSLKG
ncbi:MAG: aminotransferase class I/II-fold pyridoxal phosphate-dependent enzyme [Ruminococcaceae bacterium]|nr:aminotransferase class I/II-fold pyridoxal phosphate-dependent enzyme [Oscillospiraceae bacterium]